MNNLSSRQVAWDEEEDDDTPLLQKWARDSLVIANKKIRHTRHSVQTYAKLLTRNPREESKRILTWTTRQICTIPGLLIILWIFVLYRGEYRSFDSSISACEWANWERWPENAYPHRLVFVSDPQLVDPHTYPGRPWPLSTLTVKHTDLYMRRSYSRIQRHLFPDTIMFLGDLFDGGREWSTGSSQSPEERYHQYGNRFWQKEYGRFSSIFLHDWTHSFKSVDAGSEEEPTIRIMASLPGNHDLGFGQNIQLPVRERFNAFFGESNRIDLIGNHTFVSLDTVSLSAMDSDTSDPEIWRPAHEFLLDAKLSMRQTIQKHLQHLTEGSTTIVRHKHEVVDIDTNVEESTSPQPKGHDSADIPTILLTHVPLDRPLGKPCGPMRERWPPTPPPPGQTQPLEPDERNSLPSQGYGWQYQNALSTRVSHLIVESLGGTISRAFSGDDHDYCEVVHRAYPSPGRGIREITVKSISWAMGVRKPGFVLASLWNEIDSEGKRVQRLTTGNPETIQTHLCLLPDQISILIGYAILLGASLVLLALRATYIIYSAQNATPGLRDEDNKPILPSVTSSAEQEKLNGHALNVHHADARPQVSMSSSSEDPAQSSLFARSSAATRPRSISPLPLYGHNARPVQDRPLISMATNREGWKDVDTSEDVKWGARRSRTVRARRRLIDRPVHVQFGILLLDGIWRVARVVLIWYGWLLYR